MTDHVRVIEMIECSYQIHTHSVNEIELLLVPDGDADYVMFRGTETSGEASTTFLERIQDVWDIVRDLRILPWPVKVDGIEYRGHAGFIRGAIRVAKALEHQLRNKKLVVAGHSMGGAIALVVGLLLAKGGKPVEIVTVGAPHVFCDKVNIPDNCEITMYKKGKDIVTYVPLGRHPVKQTVVGKPSRWYPNAEDHSLHDALIAVRNKLYREEKE